MFGWFRKSEKRVSDEKLAEAYELGRRAAASANADMAAFMSRFDSAVETVADAAFRNLKDPRLPPLVLARIDLKNFIDHIDEDLGPRVLPQLRSATVKWANAMAQIGATPEFERLLQHHCDTLKTKLALAAFQRLLDMTESLKEADNQWRAANPERAAEIGVDALGDELAAALRPYLTQGNPK